MAKNPRIDRDWREPLRRSEVATDFGLSLARIEWDIFATPSFRGNVPHAKIAYGLAFRWLQELAKKCGVPYKRLLIALRGEVGEIGERFMVSPEKCLPFFACNFGIRVERLPRVVLVPSWNFNLADAALIDSVHKFCPLELLGVWKFYRPVPAIARGILMRACRRGARACLR